MQNRIFIRKYKRIIWTVITVFLIFFLFRKADFFGWDEAFYVGQMLSLVTDGDLVLQNNLLTFQLPFVEKYRALTIIMKSGAIQNCFSIGPAITMSIWTAPVKMFSYDSITVFRSIIAIGMMIILILSAKYLILVLRHFGLSESMSVWCMFISILSSPLLLYYTRFYLTAHAPGAFFSIAALAIFLCWIKQPSYHTAFASGLFYGLLAITRWQDVILIIPPIAAAIVKIQNDPEHLHRRCYGILYASVGFGLVVFLQLTAWYIQFDEWFLFPQGSSFMQWTHPKFVSFLFSPFHGAFVWAPVFMLGLLGLIFIFRNDFEKWQKVFLVSCFIVSICVVYICAAAEDWWAGASYGPRRLCSLLPFSAIGLGILLKKPSVFFKSIFTVMIIGWSLFTVSAFRKDIDDLNILFQNKRSSANPYSEEHYSAYMLQQPWQLWYEGFSKMIKPGFTFTDNPKDQNRIVGFLTVATITGLVLFLWRRTMNSKRIQIMFSMFLFGYICIFISFLLFKIPANKPYNSYWLQVLKKDDLPQNPDPPVEGLLDVAHVIKLVHNWYDKNYETAYYHMLNVSSDYMDNLNLLEIQDFVENSDNHKLIQYARNW
ncbi:hypothetical protein JW979_13480 [bacterium]|nr:hypothetical protein [candidate division CSSED10-310 bacterium]